MTEKTIKVIREIGKKHNGTFFKVCIRSELPLSKDGKTEGVKVTKVCKMTVRKGINYNSQKSVQEKVANGKVLTGMLPFGKWMKGFEGFLIEHNGNEYVRLYSSPNKAVSEYFLDGKPITIEKLMSTGFVRPSYFNHSDRPDALTVRTENIEVL